MKRLLVACVIAGCSGRLDAQPAADAALPDVLLDVPPPGDADATPPMTSCPTGHVPEGTPCDYAGVCKLSCGPCAPPLEVRCHEGRWTNTLCSPTDKGPCSHACSSDEDCDVTGEAINKCSSSLPVPVLPTPVCVSPCDPGDGSKPPYCDSDAGFCTTALGDPLCLPLCAFKDDGAAPEGCDGKNVCNFAAHGRETTTGAMVALGFCLGGCAVDADCPMGAVCQAETAWCVRARATYTKALGEACSSDSDCACFRNSSGGYCSRACKVGDSSCPAGYTCDPVLPSGFTKLPTGLLGRCLKDCTSDVDCVNSKCQQNAAIDHKTCTVLP